MGFSGRSISIILHASKICAEKELLLLSSLRILGGELFLVEGSARDELVVDWEILVGHCSTSCRS